MNSDDNPYENDPADDDPPVDRYRPPAVTTTHPLPATTRRPIDHRPRFDSLPFSPPRSSHAI
jgi:hypothetical protein